MTVGELIQHLERYPPDMRVVVNGYEEGYDDLSPEQISIVRILLDTGVHAWEGRHGDPRDATESSPNRARPVDALVLRRTSN